MIRSDEPGQSLIAIRHLGNKALARRYTGIARRLAFAHEQQNHFDGRISNFIRTWNLPDGTIIQLIVNEWNRTLSILSPFITPALDVEEISRLWSGTFWVTPIDGNGARDEGLITRATDGFSWVYNVPDAGVNAGNVDWKGGIQYDRVFSHWGSSNRYFSFGGQGIYKRQVYSLNQIIAEVPSNSLVTGTALFTDETQIEWIIITVTDDLDDTVVYAKRLDDEVIGNVVEIARQTYVRPLPGEPISLATVLQPWFFNPLGTLGSSIQRDGSLESAIFEFKVEIADNEGNPPIGTITKLQNVIGIFDSGNETTSTTGQQIILQHTVTGSPFLINESISSSSSITGSNLWAVDYDREGNRLEFTIKVVGQSSSDYAYSQTLVSQNLDDFDPDGQFIRHPHWVSLQTSSLVSSFSLFHTYSYYINSHQIASFAVNQSSSANGNNAHSPPIDNSVPLDRGGVEFFTTLTGLHRSTSSSVTSNIKITYLDMREGLGLVIYNRESRSISSSSQFNVTSVFGAGSGSGSEGPEARTFSQHIHFPSGFVRTLGSASGSDPATSTGAGVVIGYTLSRTTPGSANNAHNDPVMIFPGQSLASFEQGGGVIDLRGNILISTPLYSNYIIDNTSPQHYWDLSTDNHKFYNFLTEGDLKTLTELGNKDYYFPMGLVSADSIEF